MHNLLKDPQGCDFFHAIRLLQRHNAELPRIGYANLPKDEPVRFGQTPSLAYPSTLIETFEPAAEGRSAKLKLLYHGLLGVNGPLPLNYTEHAMERSHAHRDRTFTAFLDVFHHRMMSFLARAWADNNIAVDQDRPDDSHFRRYVGSLIGEGQASRQGGNALPDNSRLYFSGWLSRGARSTEGLGKILGDFFGTAAEVVPFRGRWLAIPPENRSRLGGARSSGVLGESVILGETVWDCCLSFRIKLGPLYFDRFRELLPGQLSFERLRSWVKSYVGEEFFWDVAFTVKSAGIPPVQLGKSAQLGYNTWLFAGQDADGVREVIFEPRAA
jgi:type VI secretion system protein ImpH